MGVNCCTVSKEKFEVNILGFNDSISEFEHSSRSIKRIHRICTMPINNSKERICTEAKSLSSTDEQNPPDETEVTTEYPSI